ncbi:hypothetical protein KBB12_02750 [Candidatus Woesebacteria bacterium]|nr:hypothetical protein [Candidatus Woesebacteria bacterium]
MSPRWEIEPITLQRVEPTRPIKPTPPVDLARLAAWQTEDAFRRHPTLSILGLSAAVAWPALSDINANLGDPGSRLYQQVIQAGTWVDANMSHELVRILGHETQLLAKVLSGTILALDHRNGPLPILAAELANTLAATAIVTGNLVASFLQQRENHTDKLAKGRVPVSPLFPIQRVVIAHPTIAQHYINTLATNGDPTYGSVHIDPTPGNMDNLGAIPGYPYRYRVGLTSLDEAAPGSRGRRRWSRHTGLERAGTIVVLPQSPGHELFGSPETWTTSPHDVVTMLQEGEDTRPDAWRQKRLAVAFPPLEYCGGARNDPTDQVVGLGRKLNADVSNISPEGPFITEMQRIAFARAKAKDPGSTEAMIGVSAAGGMNEGELSRMVDALCKDAPDCPMNVVAEIIPSDAPDPTVGYDVVVLYGPNDETVRSVAVAFQGAHSNARATAVVVAREPVTAARLAKQDIPVYTAFSLV